MRLLRAVPPAADRQRADRPRPQGLRHRPARLLRQRRRGHRPARTARASSYDVERKQVRKHGEERVFTHIHVDDRFPFELTVYAADKAHYVFKSSITGKAIERARIAELEELLAREYPDLDAGRRLLAAEAAESTVPDLPNAALAAGERARSRRKYHPEGDVLYHSLQVFELARDELPYDEEFLLAALLHDVGKAIDPQRPRRRRPGAPSTASSPSAPPGSSSITWRPTRSATARSAPLRARGWRPRRTSTT